MAGSRLHRVEGLVLKTSFWGDVVVGGGDGGGGV